MITTIVLTIFNWFLKMLVLLLPTWGLWPADLLTGLQYFAGQLATLNFLFPVDTLFNVMIFFIQFEVVYMGAKLTTYIINFFRGTGEIKI